MDFDDYPEPYENDLEEWGDREAWEDMVADRESERDYDDLDEEDDFDHPLDIAEREFQEDQHLESVWEDRYDYGV